jgi:alpha-glucosidase
VRHRVRLRPGERLFGLGNRGFALNLRGSRFALWNRDPGTGTHPGQDPIYLCVPVYLSIHEDVSYLAFYENPHRGEFDFATGIAAFAEGFD